MPTREKRAKQKKASAEIGKLMRGWKKTGKMETSRATFRPKSKAAAQRQAAAIAYGKHGLGKAGAKKGAKKRAKKVKK